MVMQLSEQARGGLRRVGYQMDTTFGWDTHELLLYTHKAINDKVPGDVIIRKRIGQPGQLTSEEADYIRRKGALGFFAWKPDECLEHDFKDIQLVERPGGGLMPKIGEAYKGCKWCRASSNNGLQGAVEQPAIPVLPGSATAEPTVEADSTPPAATTITASGEGVKCSFCPAVMIRTARNGSPRTVKQQLHALKLHTKAHSTKKVKYPD